jgi:hypothetical protein
MFEDIKRSTAFLCAAALLAVAANHVRMQAQGHFAATQRYEDVYFLPPPEYLQVFALGYREALADLIWMKALVYFGEEIVHRGDVSHLYHYTDAMLALDPRFKKVYHWVAITSIYRPGEVRLADVYKGVEYLRRGVALFPDDGDLAWDLGATYSFEIPPLLPVGDERDRAQEEGSAYLRLAALRGAGPPWLALQASAQLERLGKTEQAIRHLQEVYATATDEATRKRIEARLAQLRSAAYAEAFRHATEELSAARKRDFPYLGDTLYLLVGARPPLDGTALRLRNFDPIPTRTGGAD